MNSDKKIFMVTIHRWDGSMCLGIFDDLNMAHKVGRASIAESDKSENPEYFYSDRLTIDEIILNKEIIGSSSFLTSTNDEPFTIKKYLYSKKKK